MGLIYGDKEQNWTLIHSAYGVNIEAKFGYYQSPFGDPTEKVIESISVNGREFYLGNGHWIYADKVKGYINMEEDKDFLCYYFSKMCPVCEMDEYDWENFWLKEYKGCMWKHHVQNRMLNERLEAERKVAFEKQKAKEQELLDSFKAYADKKKLYMIREYNTVYFLKLTGKNKKAAGSVDDKQILQFARDYPGNGCDIIETREVSA